MDAAAAPPSPPATLAPRRGAALQAAAALLWLPQAALIALAVQRLADGGGFDGVLAPALGFAVLGVLRQVLDAAGARAAFAAARDRLSTLRDEALTALASRSPLDAGRASSGEAASIVAEQAEAVVPFLARFTPVRWRIALVMPAILCAVAPLSWAAALALLLAAPLIPLFMALIGWRAQAASRAQLDAMGDMNGFLLDRLRGLATVRAFDAVAPTAGRLRVIAEDLRARTMQVLRIAFLSSAVLELFAAIGVASVAVYIGLHLLGQLDIGSWGARLSLGEGLFVLLLAPAFFEPLRELAAAWHDRAAGQAALAALARLADGGLLLPAALDEAPPAAADRPPALQLDALRFAHPGAARDTLPPTSFAVASGEQVALVGASGSGKTTLLSLIAGLAPASGGRLTVDGQPVDGAAWPALRRRIAWIGQAPHVFAGSVQANVALGRPGVDGAAVQRALQAAALDGIAQAHADTPLGEGGQGLSGGEALRLAIARAAADPHADLVLADEPTAHLDRATADDVATRLLTLAQGRTLIVATHDPVLAARLGRTLRLGASTEPAR